MLDKTLIFSSITAASHTGPVPFIYHRCFECMSSAYSAERKCAIASLVADGFKVEADTFLNPSSKSEHSL